MNKSGFKNWSEEILYKKEKEKARAEVRVDAKMKITIRIRINIKVRVSLWDLISIIFLSTQKWYCWIIR